MWSLCLHDPSTFASCLRDFLVFTLNVIYYTRLPFCVTVSRHRIEDGEEDTQSINISRSFLDKFQRIPNITPSEA